MAGGVASAEAQLIGPLQHRHLAGQQRLDRGADPLGLVRRAEPAERLPGREPELGPQRVAVGDPVLVAGKARIGAELGISAQAVQQRYGAAPRPA